MSANPSYNPYAAIEAQYQAHYGHTGFNQIAYQDEDTLEIKSYNNTPPMYRTEPFYMYNTACLPFRSIPYAYQCFHLNPGTITVVDQKPRLDQISSVNRK